MQITAETASRLVETAVDTVQRSPSTLGEVLDDIPAAIYVTDCEGTITYYNKACVELAGRTPMAGDKWCVTWKLYTADGEYLPHDQCPMAVALREKRPVRDLEAIAERPDGTKFNFIPYPTPLFDSTGNLVGAVNLLLDITKTRTPEYLTDQAARCRSLAGSTSDTVTVETLLLMAAKYDEQSLKLHRRG